MKIKIRDSIKSVFTSNTQRVKPAKPKIIKKDGRKHIEIPLSKKTALLVFSPLIISLLVVFAMKYRGEIIVATVNGEPISRIELINDLELQGGSQSLETIITMKLVQQEGKKQNITISKKEIDKQIKEIESSFLSQGVSLEQALGDQRITLEQFEEQLELQLLLEKLVGNNVSVSESEINETVIEAVDSGQVDTPELRSQIKSQLERTRLAQVMQDYIFNLRDDSSVVILNGKFEGKPNTGQF